MTLLYRCLTIALLVVILALEVKTPKGDIKMPTAQPTNPEIIGKPPLMNPKSTRSNKEVNRLKRKLKRVIYQRDSLTMEHIRKDGIIGDTNQFPIMRF